MAARLWYPGLAKAYSLRAGCLWTFPPTELGAFKYELWGAYICLLKLTNKISNFQFFYRQISQIDPVAGKEAYAALG